MKPGWVRMSVHPIMTDDEVDYILDAIEELVNEREKWKAAYRYCPNSNEFVYGEADCEDGPDITPWFDLSVPDGGPLQERPDQARAASA